MTAPAVPPRRTYTIGEYVALNEASDVKHEYHDGEILAMAGGSPEHSLVIANMIIAIGGALRGKPCRIYESNLRVRIRPTRRYLYPYGTIICGPIERDPDDPSGQSVTNPRVVIEVLSPSTGSYDRRKKFDQFAHLESMAEYVLISQTEPRVEVYARRPEGRWIFTPFVGVEAVLTLESVDVRVPLADIFAGVTFPPPEPPPDPREREEFWPTTDQH